MDAVTIVALAGQRIDRPGRDRPQFPATNREIVSGRIRRHLLALRPLALVSSAACGADLLALGEAGALGIRRRVVLPFEASRFRHTSVADCSGDWLEAFDRIVLEVAARGDLEVLHGAATDMAAYAAVNHRILTLAQSIAAADAMEMVAMAVWDGSRAGDDSVTAAFVQEARARGVRVVEVPTVDADARHA